MRIVITGIVTCLVNIVVSGSVYACTLLKDEVVNGHHITVWEECARPDTNHVYIVTYKDSVEIGRIKKKKAPKKAASQAAPTVR